VGWLVGCGWIDDDLDRVGVYFDGNGLEMVVCFATESKEAPRSVQVN